MRVLRTGALLQAMDSDGTDVPRATVSLLLLAIALRSGRMHRLLQSMYAPGLPLSQRQNTKHVVTAPHRLGIIECMIRNNVCHEEEYTEEELLLSVW